MQRCLTSFLSYWCCWSFYDFWGLSLSWPTDELLRYSSHLTSQTGTSQSSEDPTPPPPKPRLDFNFLQRIKRLLEDGLFSSLDEWAWKLMQCGCMQSALLNKTQKVWCMHLKKTNVVNIQQRKLMFKQKYWSDKGWKTSAGHLRTSQPDNYKKLNDWLCHDAHYHTPKPKQPQQSCQMKTFIQYVFDSIGLR